MLPACSFAIRSFDRRRAAFRGCSAILEAPGRRRVGGAPAPLAKHRPLPAQPRAAAPGPEGPAYSNGPATATLPPATQPPTAGSPSGGPPTSGLCLKPASLDLQRAFSWRLRHLSAMAILRFPFNELRLLQRNRRSSDRTQQASPSPRRQQRQATALSPALSHISYG